MIIIGEKINSARKSIKEALADNNLDTLLKEADMQLLFGADYIDINTAGSIEREKDDLLWLIEKIQNRFDCHISIDSPDAPIVEEAIKLCKKKPFINSISAQKQRLPLLERFMGQRDSYIIVLAMDDNGMPNDVDGRISIAEHIISFADSHGISRDNIFIDTLVKPVSTEPEQAKFFLESVKLLKAKGIKCIGGLSNVSFGLPKRELLNAAFIRLALNAGIDAAIIDPTQGLVKGVLEGKNSPDELFTLAEEAVLGKDMYSMNYIKAFREGRLDF
jgi:cobalamin-dependent methionine synthase I